jgi:D-alanyl-D-alanine carboxypeptidase
VVAKEQIAFNLPRDQSFEEVRVKVKYKSPLYTPIAKGEEVATLYVEVPNYKNFQYPLFAKEEVKKGGYLHRVNQILRYKFSNLFK